MISRKTLAGFAIIAAVLADRGRADAQTPALVSHPATDRDWGATLRDNSSIGLSGGSVVTAGDTIRISGGSSIRIDGIIDPNGRSIIITAGEPIDVSGGSSDLGAGSIITIGGPIAASGGSIDLSRGTTSISTVPAGGLVATGQNLSLPPLAGLLLLPLGVDLVSLASGANQINLARAVTLLSAKAVSVSPDVEISIGLSPLELRTALDFVSGAGLAGAQSSAIRLGATVSSAISDQAAFWRSGETVDPTGIVSFQGVAGALDVATERRRGQIVADRAPALVRAWRAWGSFYGGAANVSPDVGRGSPAASSDYFGGILGLDYQIEPSWLVGVAVGGSSSRFAIASLRTSGDITAFHGGLYTSYRVGSSYVEMSETVSVFQNSTIRAINGFGLSYDRLTADFSAREYRTRVEVGHSFDLPRQIELGSATLTPFAAAEAAVYESDAFSEKSSVSKNSLALSLEEQTTTSLPTFLGLRFSNVLRLPNGWRVTPTGSVAWGHEFFPQRRLTGAFAAAPGASFTVFGPRDAYNFVQTKIGLQAHVDESVILFANFQGEFSGLTRSYGGKGGLRYSW
jgi:outer membrane autotransporter protein